MQMWVIYDHPRDFPAHFVVRLWLIVGGHAELAPDVWLRDDLAGAREVIAGNYPGGYRLDRKPDDDPTIVEVWV